VATYNEAKIIKARIDRYDSLSVSGVTDKAHPDKSFTAPTGAAWLRASWLPAETGAPCLGTTDSQDYRGVFQVDLFQPVDSGEVGTASERVGAIISHFKRGTAMTQDSLIVKVLRASRGPAIRKDGWQQYPVSIYVRAFKAQV
jgi:hypothetical protein